MTMGELSRRVGVSHYLERQVGTLIVVRDAGHKTNNEGGTNES